MPVAHDLTGRRFGRLTVSAFAGLSSCRRRLWVCACDCGATATVQSDYLLRGATSSCGCLRRDPALRVTHGASKTLAYKRWVGMIQRCTNPRSQKWPDYGARGITVCARWSESFENFVADMGECPPGGSLDRIDNDGPYSPENCRWATHEQQASNRRNNTTIVVRGEHMTIAQACKRYGVSQTVAGGRLRRGWSPERAFNITT
jgi:hypothetical protein